MVLQRHLLIILFLILCSSMIFGASKVFQRDYLDPFTIGQGDLRYCGVNTGLNCNITNATNIITYTNITTNVTNNITFITNVTNNFNVTNNITNNFTTVTNITNNFNVTNNFSVAVHDLNGTNHTGFLDTIRIKFFGSVTSWVGETLTSILEDLWNRDIQINQSIQNLTGNINGTDINVLNANTSAICVGDSCISTWSEVNETDLDEFCALDGKVLLRSGGTWQCGVITDPGTHLNYTKVVGGNRVTLKFHIP